jgi:ABC-type transport system involved in multi-copper enzyme maturation permease subunit
MSASLRAELIKLRRPRAILVLLGGAAAFAVFAAVLVFLSATDSLAAPTARGATIASLSEPGGATDAFVVGASFIGIFLLVLFIANFAGEFSQGTFRTLLMRQPRRVELLSGKMAALLLFAAAGLAVGELLTAAVSLAIAPSQGVSTGAWFDLAGLGAAAGDYGAALFMVVAWASLGMAIAVVVRSIPVALAIGIVWTGPIEHLVQDAWDPAARFFPGLLLEALAAGGTPQASVGRALIVVAVYVAIATTVAAVVFARRDVTA